MNAFEMRLSMHKDNLKNILTKFRLLGFLKQGRNVYIQLRTKILRWIYPHGKYVVCNGGPVFVDFNNENYLWYYGYNKFLQQEHDAFKFLFSKRTPKIVVDVGAHWGIFPSQLASDKSPVISEIERLICIEPDPDNLPNLKKTLAKINRFEIDVVPFAVSDKDGFISIFKGGGSCAQTYKSEHSSFVCHVKTAPLQSILCNLLVKLEDVTHIKVDIDGYEPAFFYGATDFLLKYKPFLLIEFWAKGIKAAGFDLPQYWNYLHSMYYIKEVVYPNNYYLDLSKDHLSYLETKTLAGIVNLLLLPK